MSLPLHNVSIRVGWDFYRNEIIPKTAPKVQFVESKRAFYAGAFCMLQAAVTAADLHEDEACKIMDAIDDEIGTYLKTVGTPAEEA